jgi:anti-anti-sigma factor
MNRPPEEPLAAVRMQVNEDTVRAAVTGELDMSNVDEIVAALEVACAGTRGLVLDIAEVTFLDSHSVAALYRLHSALNGTGHSLLVITGVGTPAARILDIAGLPEVMAVERDDGSTPEDRPNVAQ